MDTEKKQKSTITPDLKKVKFYADSAYKIIGTSIQFELEGEYDEEPHKNVYTYSTSVQAEISKLRKHGYKESREQLKKVRDEKIKANRMKVLTKSKVESNVAQSQ